MVSRILHHNYYRKLVCIEQQWPWNACCTPEVKVPIWPGEWQPAICTNNKATKKQNNTTTKTRRLKKEDKIKKKQVTNVQVLLFFSRCAGCTRNY